MYLYFDTWSVIRFKGLFILRWNASIQWYYDLFQYVVAQYEMMQCEFLAVILQFE